MKEKGTDRMSELDAPETQEKIEELKKLLNASKEIEEEKTDIGGPQPGSPIKGSDINWDEYDLDPNFAHFYPKAELIQDGDTFKWVAAVFEFYSFSLPYNGQGVNDKGLPKGFGAMLTYLTNGPEKWQIAQILPNGAGMGAAILQRRIAVTLPDPVPILTETNVEKPTDEELVSEESRAMDWINKTNEEIKNIKVEETNDLPEVNNTAGTEQ